MVDLVKIRKKAKEKKEKSVIPSVLQRSSLPPASVASRPLSNRTNQRPMESSF